MYVLPPLPYGHDALAPTIGGDTLRTHHGKHHKRYVDVTNEIVGAQETRPLEEVVREAGSAGQRKLYNNAAQAWNHAFFWACMSPNPATPTGELAQAIARDFGGLEGLKARFVDEGANHFASGWAWLVARGDKLEVVSTHDAGSFDQLEGATPLLVCDVWEHAYYLDYKNDRKSFVEAWFDRVLDWSFAERQLQAGRGGDGGYRYPAPTA
jgi:Fe-Mn family superoxide dismutase